MSVTMPRMLIVACLLSPSLSWALGLGEIHLNSALNEPMNAEIDLIAAAPDELTALRASLASREAFTRYGIDKPPFLSSLTFKVGKSKDGRDALLVRSTDAIPEPFVTFLVEVNWARGRLMREYTVLLDPPVYTPGESPGSSPAVAAASTAPPATATPPTAAAAKPNTSASSAAPSSSTGAASTGSRRSRRAAQAAAAAAAAAAANDGSASTAASSPPPAAPAPDLSGSDTTSVHVNKGDTLSKIAHRLHADTPADVDQTMIALYRSNPAAFGGNINVLRQGTVLRVPAADEIAALNQKEAMGEVHRQMDAWRGGETTAAASNGHLRLVTPTSGSATGGTGTTASTSGDGQNLKDRVRDLEGQLADSKRLIDIRNGELSDLQRKLAAQATPGQPTQSPPVTSVQPATPPVGTAPPATPPGKNAPPVIPPLATATPPAKPATPMATDTAPNDVNAVQPLPPAPPPLPVKKPPAPAVDSGSWIDWVAANWWVPLALLGVVVAALAIAAMRRRRKEQSNDVNQFMDDNDGADAGDPTSKMTALRRGSESFLVEETGEHPAPEFGAEPHLAGDPTELKSAEDTLSSESAVNLDQGDPLAEADFHMAYGLYDQAADLVRIALEREPDRRDLRLKLLEIYFVWGNKDAFLQTAKGLESTRDRAPAGEWDKIVIMGKQICPDEPMFASVTGSGRGAGALVDLNLEGGENRVDIDLFGDPEGERSHEHQFANDSDNAATGESPHLDSHSGLDFTLDTPERGADESPTREMAPRDEPTVESELMNFSNPDLLDMPGAESPTREAPALKTAEARDRLEARLPPQIDRTAEVSIEDLGLNLDHLEETGSPDGIAEASHENSLSSNSLSHLEETEHPADAPTMVAGLDERSRRMMADAEKNARDRDLTELERELEASFVADLGEQQDEIKTAVLGPESAPTVLMPREVEHDLDSTSRLKGIHQGIHSESIDLDLDKLASALGSNDTVEQPRAAEEVFSTEVFEASQRSRRVDLDVGEAMNGVDAPTNRLQAQTNKLKPVDLAEPELEPVTMSEVGTKLDLARAYMDMGDPEGARSILEEVVSEGSTSQKQEASRLIESLPG